MPENNTANFNDILTVEVKVDEFKKSLDQMAAVYETFINGLDDKTKAGLGQGLSGNLNAVLKDLSASILEFRKDFTGTLSQLDVGLQKFFETVEAKSAASAKRRAQAVAEENDNLDEIFRRNTDPSIGLSTSDVEKTLSGAERNDAAEQKRRDILLEQEGQENALRAELIDIEKRIIQLRGQSAQLGFKRELNDASTLNDRVEVLANSLRNVKQALVDVSQGYQNAQRSAKDLAEGPDNAVDAKKIELEFQSALNDLTRVELDLQTKLNDLKNKIAVQQKREFDAEFSARQKAQSQELTALQKEEQRQINDLARAQADQARAAERQRQKEIDLAFRARDAQRDALNEIASLQERADKKRLDGAARIAAFEKRQGIALGRLGSADQFAADRTALTVAPDVASKLQVAQRLAGQYREQLQLAVDQLRQIKNLTPGGEQERLGIQQLITARRQLNTILSEQARLEKQIQSTKAGGGSGVERLASETKRAEEALAQAEKRLSVAQLTKPSEQLGVLTGQLNAQKTLVESLRKQLSALDNTAANAGERFRLTKELGNATSELTRLTSAFNRTDVAAQNFLQRMIHGFKNTLSLVIRFYATFAALQAAIDVIKFTIGAPFEILADGLRYMVGIEEAASNLTGVLAANAIFSKDQAENFKIAAEVSKDLVELLKQRAIASGSTFESLDATFKALLQGGAGQTVRNLEELVQLAEVFQLSIKAAGAGGLAAQGSIQEIAKLFQGLPGDYNKFLALLKVTPAEFKKMVAEAKNNRDLLDQLVDRIGPYVDQVKLAELNQARLAKSFGELIDRIGAAGSKPLFNFITDQLKVAVKFLEENFERISAFVEGLARSVAFLGEEITSAVGGSSGSLQIWLRIFLSINEVILKTVSSFSLLSGLLKDYVVTLTSSDPRRTLPSKLNDLFTQGKDRINDYLRDLERIETIGFKALESFDLGDVTESQRKQAQADLKLLRENRKALEKEFEAAGGIKAKPNVVAEFNKQFKLLDEVIQKTSRIARTNRLSEAIDFINNPGSDPKANKKDGRDALRELLAQLDAAQEKYKEAADDIKERNKEIRLSIDNQVAERAINYADAAQQIRENVNAETKELDKLRSSVFSLAKDIESKIKVRIIDPTIQSEGLAKLQKDVTQFRRQEGRSDFQRETEAIRADKNAAKERLALNKERAEQTLRVEEESLKRQQELLSIYREAGIFTERQYFDEVDKLRAKQFDIDAQRIQAQLQAAGADPDERLKFENQLAVLKAKFSASEEAAANRRINLLQQEAQLARDYAVALAQVDIQSQQALLDTIQSLQPDVGYNNIIAESINLRAQELDLLEQNLRIQRDIAAEKNAESQETRGLNLQLLDLINNRNELFNQRIKAIQSGTSGVLATRSSISGAFDQEFAARQLAVSAAQSRVQSFVSANGVPGLGGFDPQLIGQFQALQNELTLTSRSLTELREEGFKAVFKDFGKIFRADQVARVFGRGFSEAFSSAKTGTDKLVVGLEGAAQAAGFFIQGVQNIQQGIQQGGTLGGVGAGISSFGGAATGLLSLAFKSSKAIPVVGQLLEGLAPVLGFIGSLFTASAKRIAEDIKKSFSATIENYQNGNASLVETIQILERQRLDAITRLSGTKGGKKELDPLLKEFDQQIKQLRDQQKEILSSFEDSLNVLRSGSETLTEINRKWTDINNQVKDYIGAGGDAAKAQEFLSLQLGKIRQDAAKELAQAEQDAIQEALRLNDLLKERQKIIDDFAKKEFDTINRTSIERRKSNAVATGEELKALREARDQQLADLDNQIRVATERVNRQREIFTLDLDIAALHRRDEELALAALDLQIQKLRDLKSIADSIVLGPNGLFGSNLLPASQVNINVNLAGLTPGEAGVEIADSLENELNRRFRMVPAF